MKILIASITNASASVLRAHLQSITLQELPTGVEVEYFYLTDPSISPESLETLDAFGITHASAAAKPKDATYAITPETHAWSIPTFHWLAREKQRLLDQARLQRFDAIWLCDSDLVCSPETLSSLITSNKPIVSAVFWTRWQANTPALPQVWMTHPYGFDGKGIEGHEFLRKLADRSLVQVGGLGACTLIRADALDFVGFWPLVEGLPSDGMWQGEDRHFCVQAQRHHVPLWADAWPDIFHIYRPDEDLERVPSFSLKHASPTYGDFVSLVLEPCEGQEGLGQRHHVRGRLGSLKLLPEIESILQEMEPGEDRFVRLTYPMWWEWPQLRGQSRTILVRLLGVKPPSVHPV